MVVLKEIFMVWALLGVIDIVLAALEELVQVLTPLVAKYTKRENIYIMANMATEHLIVFNIGILLTCIVSRV